MIEVKNARYEAPFVYKLQGLFEVNVCVYFKYFQFSHTCKIHPGHVRWKRFKRGASRVACFSETTNLFLKFGYKNTQKSEFFIISKITWLMLNDLRGFNHVFKCLTFKFIIHIDVYVISLLHKFNFLLTFVVWNSSLLQQLNHWYTYWHRNIIVHH